jgi:hypothetical protein
MREEVINSNWGMWSNAINQLGICILDLEGEVFAFFPYDNKTGPWEGDLFLKCFHQILFLVIYHMHAHLKPKKYISNLKFMELPTSLKN